MKKKQEATLEAGPVGGRQVEITRDDKYIICCGTRVKIWNFQKRKLEVSFNMYPPLIKLVNFGNHFPLAFR